MNMLKQIYKIVISKFKRTTTTEVIEITDLGLWDSPFSSDLAATLRHINEGEREKKKRIPIQPIEIIHDLEKGVKFPLDNIHGAIKELEERIKFMKETLQQTYVRDEERALDMLKARKKYPNHAHLFKWKTTTDEHIKGLLDKYDLAHNDVSQYVRKIPLLAMDAMRVYDGILKKVTSGKPIFSIIAPTEYFRDPKAKTDPILLAESPFGKYYYILAAWDKEVSMVSELLDGEELVVDKNGKATIK